MISKHSKEDRSDFRNELLTRDTKQIFTVDRPKSVEDTDVILVLLQNWEDVKKLPLQEELGIIYQTVQGFDSTRFRYFATLEFVDGTPIFVAVYNDSAVQNGTRNCYAKDFIFALNAAESEGAFDFEACVQQGY